MTLPDMHSAEAIPPEARAEIDRLLSSGDLFRYTAARDAPVSLLEAEFAAMMGSRFALAVSSCSAALFLSLKALGLPRDARVLIPDVERQEDRDDWHDRLLFLPVLQDDQRGRRRDPDHR